MLYLDTSLVVALVAPEARSSEARRWLEEQSSEVVAISDWVVTEVSSAFSVKQRTGSLDDVARARADRAFERLSRDVFEVLPVPRAAFVAAAGMSGQPELTLRGGDALHLAIAAEHQARLCTRDIRQADAGRRLGFETSLPLDGGTA
jgi:predicted nucleic acid-binding protein